MSPVSRFRVAVGDVKHELQDLRRLMLHEEAVRLMQRQPALTQQAIDTLNQWRAAGHSRCMPLWDEWAFILHRRAWRRALGQTRRSKELRQASPITTVLPAEVRQRVLNGVQRLKKGIRLGAKASSSKTG